jgi:hypothetical protein
MVAFDLWPRGVVPGLGECCIQVWETENIKSVRPRGNDDGHSGTTVPLRTTVVRQGLPPSPPKSEAMVVFPKNEGLFTMRCKCNSLLWYHHTLI